ncbi:MULTISPECIES: zinc-binding alcohol dehydrogenase family protein [unclassified Curtobacterium]|uniref:quinone oxidoreductase family protein n=1 Tax=unclassified Curtobacterium TaxID=257496 RepID=UPI0021ABAE01|nr:MULTISPECIES: zinc-binding alcohol dehydrogenase family protein [unclassified Curtobacterium]
MPTMHAAVVTAFGEPPRSGAVPVPEPRSGHEELVDVVAVGLHPRTRSGAAGAHYTSTGVLPMVPGVDAVGRRADGALVYFVADDDVIGTMAERAVVDRRRSVVLPDGIDPLRVAATMNPAMSSWVALRRRVPVRPGRSVLVLGATGSAGSMAVRIAKHLGAGRVVAAGRDRRRLDALAEVGADSLVQLGVPAADAALGAAAADVDIVLDYLWGAPTEQAIRAVLTARRDRSAALHWIQIGSVAGPDISLPSAVLRGADLRLLGNGQGAVSPAGYLAELPSLVAEIDAGGIVVEPVPVALGEIEHAWGRDEEPGQRIVVVP